MLFWCMAPASLPSKAGPQWWSISQFLGEIEGWKWGWFWAWWNASFHVLSIHENSMDCLVTYLLQCWTQFPDMQRERTGKLKMSDLAQHFHLPINAAAKELGICPTVLKKICRRNGMRRWPHRKVKNAIHEFRCLPVFASKRHEAIFSRQKRIANEWTWNVRVLYRQFAWTTWGVVADKEHRAHHCNLGTNDCWGSRSRGWGYSHGNRNA